MLVFLAETYSDSDAQRSDSNGGNTNMTKAELIDAVAEKANVTKADAENRLTGLQGKLHGWNAQARITRSARAWAQKHGVILGQQVWKFGLGHDVVAQNLGLCAKLLQITVQRVNEAVVVVENQNLCHVDLSLPSTTMALELPHA